MYQSLPNLEINCFFLLELGIGLIWSRIPPNGEPLYPQKLKLNEVLKETSYDDDAEKAEEKHFLKNYTIPFIQLDPRKSILCFSHDNNTFDKRKLLENPHPDFVKKIISYEPFPDLFNIAKINLASVKNIKQNNYGWAKKKGNYTFYENISNSGDLSLIKNKQRNVNGGTRI